MHMHTCVLTTESVYTKSHMYVYTVTCMYMHIHTYAHVCTHHSVCICKWQPICCATCCCKHTYDGKQTTLFGRPVCMHVCMHECVYATSINICVCVYACIRYIMANKTALFGRRVCMYVCIHVSICKNSTKSYTHMQIIHACIHIYIPAVTCSLCQWIVLGQCTWAYPNSHKSKSPCTCVCIRVCVRICMYVCILTTHVSLTYTAKKRQELVCMYPYVYVDRRYLRVWCMDVCIYACACLYYIDVCINIYIYIYIYVCMYVYLFRHTKDSIHVLVCMYIHTHNKGIYIPEMQVITHTYIHTWENPSCYYST
jgi:hypothetical protein